MVERWMEIEVLSVGSNGMRRMENEKGIDNLGG